MADVREWHIDINGTGLFTAVRHVRLLCHLAGRTADEAEYHYAHPLPDTRTSPSPSALAEASVHLGQAVAHYTQALAPLLSLVTAGTRTRSEKLTDVEHHRRLRIHLKNAAQVLSAAHTCLLAPAPPRHQAASTPTAPRHSVASPHPRTRT